MHTSREASFMHFNVRTYASCQQIGLITTLHRVVVLCFYYLFSQNDANKNIIYYNFLFPVSAVSRNLK